MKRQNQKLIWGGVVTTAVLLLATPVRGQQPATVLLIDRNAIRADVAPNYFPPMEINATIADVGVRDSLPFFNARQGQPLTLTGGTTGHEGWLAFTSIPSSWSSSGETDGLDNFVYAGPGLGSPDVAGSRISKLGAKAEVVPLGPAGLQQLTGRTVCAIAYSGELPRTPSGVTLSGANLGILAFTVDAISGGSGTTLPNVGVTVLDSVQVCGGDLVAMADAPAAGQ